MHIPFIHHFILDSCNVAVKVVSIYFYFEKSDWNRALFWGYTKLYFQLIKLTNRRWHRRNRQLRELSCKRPKCCMTSQSASARSVLNNTKKEADQTLHRKMKMKTYVEGHIEVVSGVEWSLYTERRLGGTTGRSALENNVLADVRNRKQVSASCPFEAPILPKTR